MLRKYTGQKKLSELTEVATLPSARKHGFAIFKIVTNWPNIVGDFLSIHSTPKSLQFPFNSSSKGVLYISVENPGFSLEIQASEIIILQKISSFFGYKAVDRIVVEIARSRKKTSSNTQKAYPKTVISSNEKSEMERTIYSVEDEKLKEVLASISKYSFDTNS